mgnify:CR=1 FL=1
MEVRPLHDRVLVERWDEEEKTKGGIIIPDSAKEKPIEGEVIAVGGVPEEELDLDKPVPKDGKPEPVDPVAREKALFDAFEVIVLRNKRGEFTAGGQPHLKTLPPSLADGLVAALSCAARLFTSFGSQMPTKTSPGLPCARTWRANTSS